MYSYDLTDKTEKSILSAQWGAPNSWGFSPEQATKWGARLLSMYGPYGTVVGGGLGGLLGYAGHNIGNQFGDDTGISGGPTSDGPAGEGIYGSGFGSLTGGVGSGLGTQPYLNSLISQQVQQDLSGGFGNYNLPVIPEFNMYGPPVGNQNGFTPNFGGK